MALSDAYCAPTLVIQVHDHSDAVRVVAVCGDLDRDSAPHLQQTVIGVLGRGGMRCLVVDLAEVDFCGAAGVRALLSCNVQAHQLGARLQVRGARDPVRRVLAVCSVLDNLGLPA